MSSENRIEFNRENIDTYLKEVAKEYRKQIGKNMPAELILIGGASVLINYGFREMTTDIDAVIHAASVMRDAVCRVGDRFNLPAGWLNEDFKRTSSYSDRLVEFSQYYRTYSNVLTVRTISAEYLVAMKLRSGRQYRNDLSDILGILSEHAKNEHPLTLTQIQKAVTDLYGGWETLPESSQHFIADVMDDGHFGELYEQAVRGEKDAGNLLLHLEQNYPGVVKEEKADKIAENLLQKAGTASILAQLRERRMHHRSPVPEENTGKQNGPK